MRQLIQNASLVTLGLLAGAGFTAFAADPGKTSSSKAKAAVSSAVPGPEPVEYRIMLLSGADAATATHEKQLNELGAEGWRVVSPIYSGGILNSYLMTRSRQAK